MARSSISENFRSAVTFRRPTVLSSLAQMYDDVVIDTVLTYDDRMLAVLDLADLYVVVVAPHLGTLRSARSRMLGLNLEAQPPALTFAVSFVGTKNQCKKPPVRRRPIRAMHRASGSRGPARWADR